MKIPAGLIVTASIAVLSALCWYAWGRLP